MKTKARIVRAAVMLALAHATPSSAATIWIEGESYVRTNRMANAWAAGDRPEVLSGGGAAAFVESSAHFPLPLYVLWRVEVPETATYALFLRAMAISSNGNSRVRFIRIDPLSGLPLKRPLPSEGWHPLDPSATPLESVPAGEWRRLDWTYQGSFPLEAGTYLLDIQSTGLSEPRNDIWLGLDVICLTSTPGFQPRGAERPQR